MLSPRTITAGAAIAGALLSGLAAFPAPARATAAWRVECTGDGKTLDCRAVQQLVHSQTRQSLALVMVRRGKDSKTATITIVLPLGLDLTEPVQIRVDNGKPESVHIQTCTNTGCFVVMTARERLLTAMRSGRLLKIAVQDANRKRIELSLPLLGFGLAFDKARS